MNSSKGNYEKELFNSIVKKSEQIVNSLNDYDKSTTGKKRNPMKHLQPKKKKRK